MVCNNMSEEQVNVEGNIHDDLDKDEVIETDAVEDSEPQKDIVPPQKKEIKIDVKPKKSQANDDQQNIQKEVPHDIDEESEDDGVTDYEWGLPNRPQYARLRELENSKIGDHLKTTMYKLMDSHDVDPANNVGLQKIYYEALECIKVVQDYYVGSEKKYAAQEYEKSLALLNKVKPHGMTEGMIRDRINQNYLVGSKYRDQLASALEDPKVLALFAANESLLRDNTPMSEAILSNKGNLSDKEQRRIIRAALNDPNIPMPEKIKIAQGII